MRAFSFNLRSTDRFQKIRALTVCGVVCLAACGGGGGGGGTTNPTTTKPVPTGPTDVTVANNSFTPGSLTVTAGSTVTWTWNTCTGGDPYGGGQTCVSHSVLWDADGTGSAIQDQGSYQKAFPTAGTYAYHCAVHGAAMSGKVVVQ